MDYYYADNNCINDSSMEGQISDLFSAPVIPKMIIVGLSEIEVAGSAELRVFKDILERALNNLFVIEFLEQFIPRMNKIPSNQVHYRNHEVKESWMYKIRQEYPALLVDFRLLSLYNSTTGIEDDTVLIEQISQTRNSLPIDGPIYLVWLAGRGISNQRISSILKASKMDKSTISLIELTDDSTRITATLKARIQECFEHSRQFYQNLSKKYKKLSASSDQLQKFVQPWMASVYYYFKIAVLEEFRGDFHSALKYYHTILSKFKELIEDVKENVEQKYQIINYLRRFADICFIRLSFLLFRLDQSSEAEFGLFRYLNYFSHGLSQSDQLLWRYSMSRGYARQLMKSTIWSSKPLMRGPAHFFIYGLSQVEKYLKYHTEAFQIQEMILLDLSEALDSALKQANLGYFVDFLQILILNQYISSSIDDSKAFINYLKTSTKIRKWKFIESDILKKSVEEAKREQDYQTAVIDEWQKGIEDSGSFEDWCLMYAQMYQEPIRLVNVNKYIYCNVRFLKRICEIFQPCGIELNIYIRKSDKEVVVFKPESIGIFFDNESIDPITFDCQEELKPGEVKTFRSEFVPSKLCKNGKLKISFVTMQLKRPFIALQFDDSCFFHQQNCPSEKFLYESMEFIRLCQETLKNMLTLRIEPLKPQVEVNIQYKESFVLVGSELAVLLNFENATEHATMTNFTFNYVDFKIELGPNESRSIGVKYKVPNEVHCIKIKMINKFNLELMDFRFTEICSFEPFEQEISSEIIINPINPFTIKLSRGIIEISAFYDLEWLTLTSTPDLPRIIRKGEKVQFNLPSPLTFIKGSFRLLDDPNNEIYQHEWKIE